MTTTQIKTLALIGFTWLLISGCASSDEDFDTASTAEGDSAPDPEFAVEEEAGDISTEDENQVESEIAQQNDLEPSFDDTNSNAEKNQAVESAPLEDDFGFDVEPSVAGPPAAEEIPVPQANNTFEETIPAPDFSPVENLPMPDTESAMAEPLPAPTSGAMVEISGFQYKANQAGGTLIISATGPFEYTTRSNPELNQFIVEVSNAVLPGKYKRPLNMRDIGGNFGSVDAYQDPGSSTARFVVQLRDGVQEPSLQMEGNSLLVIGGSAAPTVATLESNSPYNESFNEPTLMAEGSGGGSEDEASGPESVDKIFTSQSLYQFLTGNTQFYGRKISIEMNNMDVRDSIKFISDESGANIIFSDEVQGTISLKLKQVPWDQALLMIMRAKKLGYTRQGNVLRIAPLAELKAEEEDAGKLIQARKTLETLKVKVFPVSYSKVDDLEKKVKEFLSERGKVIGDVRTNSLVVTDVQDHLDRVSRLLQSLDRAPSQVFIEAKIVEAKEAFIRNIGVNWGFNGGAIPATGSGPQLRPNLNISPSEITAAGGAAFRLTYGTIDSLGTLNAAIALNESERKVKILSAPQLLTLSNETATISQTTEIPVRTTTISAGVPTTSFTFKPLALTLEVNPQITVDSSVLMRLNINRSFRDAGVSVEDENFAINTRSANTKVLVRNGQTAVIGGIYQTDSTEGEFGVPFLKDIPILGNLFKSQTRTKDKLELMIFLTPRIVNEIATEASPSAEPDDFTL